MSLVVRFLSGARRGAEIQLEGAELRVGEDPSCDVFLDPRQDPAVCGRRATIQLKDDGWYARSTGEYPVLLNQATLVDERRIRSGDVLRMSETGPDLLISIERHVPKRPAVTEPIRHLVPQPAQTAEHPPVHTIGLSPPSGTDRAKARRCRSDG